MDYKVKIGLVPIRRNLPGKRTGIFNPDYAVKNKQDSLEFIKKKYSVDNVEFTDVDFLNDEGLLLDENDVDMVAERFRAEKVDAIFIINCNFGNEEAAGMLADQMGKPVLIWAPQDEIFEADGTRYTDAQCGLFAISKYLGRRTIPFSYIKNCNIKDPAFDEGLKKFISVACMVKNFKGLKIAQVGTRPKPFTSVMINEEELLNKFGIHVIPVNMASIITKHAEIMRDIDGRLEKDAAAFEQKYKQGHPGNEQTKKIMALKYVYKQILDEYNCDIIATECWTAMPQVMEVTPCCAMSELADENIIVTCETDIKGSITMALLAAASLGKSTPYFAEFTTRHPDNKSAELLWHCGPFAYSLKKTGSKATCENFRCNFAIKDGEYTIARMDSEKDNYFLFADKFKSTDGPYTFGNYIWAEFEKFDKVEEKLIQGPYIHHMAEIEGDHVEALKEFCKFIPYLSIDLVD